MTTDATQITSSLLREGGARPGDVLAERYELLEALGADGASLGYRAIDQETERAVLVRMLAGPGLREQALKQVLDELRGVVGMGGRFLSTLLDADREGQHPFTVEAWPSGTPLSRLLEARRAHDPRLHAREVLPLAAQIQAALAAIAAPWHHGDLRAENVWVDGDAVRVTGAFLLSALPPALLAERVTALGPGALAYAPEVRAGQSGGASDRFGLAAIVCEALTGQGPDLEERPPELSPPLFDALRRLLARAPEQRPNDVAALLAALSTLAGLGIPRLDPEPRRPAQRRPPIGPRRIEGAAAEGTQEISFDQILEEHALESDAPAVELQSDELVIEGEEDEDALDPDLVHAALNADDTTRRAPVAAETRETSDGLDPRLVRAALGVNIDDSPAHADDELDPRLVRAALDVSAEEPAVEMPEPPVVVAPFSPPPHADTASEPERPPPRAASGADGSTAVIRRPPEPRVARRASSTGPLIVLGALLIGVAIIAAAILIRSWMTEEQDSRERSRHIQERLQELRGTDP